MKIHNNNTNRGFFTLSESLVIIGIIAILAALLYNMATSDSKETKVSFVKIFGTKSNPTSPAELQSAKASVVWKLIILQQEVNDDQKALNAVALKLKDAPRSNPEEVAICVELLQQLNQSSNFLAAAKSELSNAFHVAYNSGYRYETQVLGYSEPPSCGCF